MDANTRRKLKNKELVERMRRGESLQDSPNSTWYPPRPTIKKDLKAINLLYDTKKVEN
jgi:hypothetical protein